MCGTIFSLQRAEVLRNKVLILWLSSPQVSGPALGDGERNARWPCLKIPSNTRSIPSVYPENASSEKPADMADKYCGSIIESLTCCFGISRLKPVLRQ